MRRVTGVGPSPPVKDALSPCLFPPRSHTHSGLPHGRGPIRGWTSVVVRCVIPKVSYTVSNTEVTTLGVRRSTEPFVTEVGWRSRETE